MARCSLRRMDFMRRRTALATTTVSLSTTSIISPWTVFRDVLVFSKFIRYIAHAYRRRDDDSQASENFRSGIFFAFPARTLCCRKLRLLRIRVSRTTAAGTTPHHTPPPLARLTPLPTLRVPCAGLWAGGAAFAAARPQTLVYSPQITCAIPPDVALTTPVRLYRAGFSGPQTTWAGSVLQHRHGFGGASF